MKPAVSWRIEGIAPLARESAREAARRAGLSLGEWLNAAIIDSASDALAQKPASRAGEESPRKLAEAIARLSERLEELVEGRGDGPPDASRKPAPPPADEHSPDLDLAVAEIVARQRSLEGGTIEAEQTPPNQVPGVHREIETGAADAETTSTDAVDAETASIGAADAEMASTETASANATATDAADTGASDARPALPQAEIHPQSVPGLERYLAHISEQIEMLQRPNRFEADLADLRRDLAEIKQSLAGPTSRSASGRDGRPDSRARRAGRLGI